MPSPQTIRARQLRRDMTKVEWRLWSRLRSRRLDGYKFRRQVPIGRYIVDFVCLSARLIVEVDGPAHDARVDADLARTSWLEAQGFRELRFSADHVAESLDEVAEAIWLALHPEPLPTLPGERGGE